MKISDLYPSKFIKADDLGGQRVQVQIMSLTVEEVSDKEHKPVLRFLRHEKGMVLNKTNATSLAAAFGDDSVSWQGQSVELMALPTTFNGKQVMGLVVMPIHQTADQQPPPAFSQPQAVQDLNWEAADQQQRKQFQQPGPHDHPGAQPIPAQQPQQRAPFDQSEAGPAIQKGAVQQQMEQLADDMDKAEAAAGLDPLEPIPF